MKKSNKKLGKGIYLIPNLITTINLFLGFYAIIMIFEAYALKKSQLFQRPQLFTWAAYAIIIAIILDGLDGRFARLTKTTSQFGMEYDSLADLTTFGMAPALLIYAYGLKDYGRAGWLAVFLYFACVTLRLARFNTQSKTVEKEGFQGLPSPAGAGFIAAVILMKPKFNIEGWWDMAYMLFLPYLLALLMVSSVGYRNFKEVHFKKTWAFSALILMVAFIIILASHPVMTIFIIFSVYVSSGLIEEFYLRAFARKKTEDAALEEQIPIQNDVH